MSMKGEKDTGNLNKWEQVCFIMEEIIFLVNNIWAKCYCQTLYPSHHDTGILKFKEI